MERISKNEMSYLISRNIIQQNRGNYGESLIVTGKFGSGRNKQRFVTPFVYRKLLEFKNEDKQELVDVGKIKDNQRYLVSGSGNSKNIAMNGGN